MKKGFTKLGLLALLGLLVACGGTSSETPTTSSSEDNSNTSETTTSEDTTSSEESTSNEGTSSSEEDSNSENETDNYVTEVAAEKAYKLMINQKGLGKHLYSTGKLSGYYGTSTEKESEAVDFVLKETTGGYYIGFLDGTTSKFINAEASGTHNNIKFEESAKSVWTFNTEYHTLTTTCGENTVYIGTYGTYTTFSLSKISYITGSTNYPARLYASSAATPAVIIPNA